MAVRAKAIGVAMQTEDGVGKAADFVEDFCMGRWAPDSGGTGCRCSADPEFIVKAPDLYPPWRQELPGAASLHQGPSQAL